ncbi:MAG: MarR family winged helix-turn-helix transcriptional regulator [Cyanobacteria bacterium P01_A01_bin.37]
MIHDPFLTDGNDLAGRVLIGLTKIGIALKSQSWQDANTSGLSPTQGQILALLHAKGSDGLRLSAIAQELSVTPATASDAVATLVDKGLVLKDRAADDRRAIAITLTDVGQQQAEKVLGWSDFLKVAVDELSAEEQVGFLQGLIKIIRNLQQQGHIPIAHMCVTCQHFRPNVYDNPDYPHHCNFVDAPFGNQHLQVDCPDYYSPLST